MNADNMFMFVYYALFAIISTALFVSFIRMRNEEMAAVLSGIIALFCWLAVVLIVIYGI